MRLKPAAVKLLCGLLIVTNTALGFYNIAWAAPQDTARSAYDIKVDGYNSGMDFLRQAQENARKFSVAENGDISFGNERLDNIVNEDSSAFNVSQLSPDTAHPENADQYYVSGKLPDINDLKGVQGASETQLDELGSSSHDTLKQDAESDSPTIQGMVFGLLNDTANLSKPSFDNDPMLTNINTVLSGVDGNPFTDCGIDYQILNIKQSVHNSELVKCLDQRAESCSLTHNPVLAVLKYTNNEAIYGSCGENCISYYIGKFPYDTSEPLTPGSCTSGTVSTGLQLINKDAILKASIESVDYAGSVFAYMPATRQNTSDKILFSYDSEGDSILSTDEMDCTSSTAAIKVYPQADITEIVKNAQNGEQFTFTILYKGAVPYATLNVTYDPTKVARYDTWSGSNQCLLNAEAITSGELDGEVRCTNDITTPSGDVILSGVQLDPKYLNQSYGLKGSCTQAEVTVNVTSIDQTAESNLDELPLCADLEKRGCGFVSSRCLKYGAGEKFDNTCLIKQSTYDCGYSNDLTVPQTVEQYACPGSVACMGTDCLNIIIGSEDSEKDFSKALGLLQESQQAANDMACTHTGRYDEDGNEILDCSLFGGEADECRNSFTEPLEVLGAESCCSGGDVAGNWAQFVRQSLQMSKVGAVRELASFGQLTGLGDTAVLGNLAGELQNGGTGWFTDTAGVAGMEGLSLYGMGWDLFKNFTGIGATIDAVITPATNALNNLIPYAGDIFAGIVNYEQDLIVAYVMEKYVLGSLISAVETAISSAAGSTAGGAASATITSSVEDWAKQKMFDAGMSVGTINSTVAFVGSAISIVGTIYAVYSAAKVVVGMLTACKSDEYELQSNIMVKKCDKVGNYCSKELDLVVGKICVTRSNTYCCFESPLSRILNKQIKYSLKGCGRVLWPDNNPGCAFGPDGEHPDCSPITLEQLEAVDWTQIDLTEWLELLKASDVLSSDDVSLDGLSDNYLPVGGYDKNGNAMQ